MSENEDIATVAKRVQDRLRQPIPHETRELPILREHTKPKSPDVNVIASGAAPKGKRVIPSKQGKP